MALKPSQTCQMCEILTGAVPKWFGGKIDILQRFWIIGFVDSSSGVEVRVALAILNENSLIETCFLSKGHTLDRLFD